MSVLVEFPGGIRREVPSQLRAIGAEHSRAYEFEQVPLNCDPQWKYKREGGRWIATHRQGQLLSMRPAAPAWWHFVDLMMEPERRASEAATAQSVGSVKLQSAA